jgi:hypothetical protein
MISITNISKEVRGIGVHVYEVRINNTAITTFEHKREEGLATCLAKASEAVERAKWLKVMAEITACFPLNQRESELDFTYPPPTSLTSR